MKDPGLDEQELIVRSRDGDTRAFEELVRLHQGIAMRVAYLVTRNPHDAEDVTQDAFVKAYRSLKSFKLDAPFRPWLLAIVRNVALNRVRSRKRRDRLTVRTATDRASDDTAPSPETAVITRDQHDRLLAAIDQLPDRYREIISHRYLLDLSERETSEILSIPAGTVKSRTARALDRLRANLDISRDELT
ncbi:MAG: RNA polymerase sigma factor [Actinomycetota bacterium]